MNDKEFIEAVANMRELQKRYFKERSSIILQQCKKAEQKVDSFLRQKNDKQRNLFS